MSDVNEIRSTFLDYFRKNGHEIVSSGPLVPRNDPTLMFTNAGMVQFKNIFTGLEQPSYKRVVTSQKCVRAGGKHNDLDNVGYTARHHTFFEMLGNFSFGDYFKEEAIYLAWDLIIREFRLSKDRLLVTVYHTDDDAANFWKKIAGLADERIIRIQTNDNFWAMGDTGPCGPCSEIFYDHGTKIKGGLPGSIEEDGDRFIEIWNLVFMQFEQTTKEGRIALPRPSIDTGMGLERIAAILQGVHDNYDIDLFRTLICASEEETGVQAKGKYRASHRVIADHLRAASFLIADGVLPSNEGRGYVLRRILRRAMRHTHLLGTKDSLLWKLLPVLTQEMGQAYPELVQTEALISNTLRLEEIRFHKTLERGLKILNEATENLSEGDQLDGETAFRLYDTYGFPLDLTQDILRQRIIGVDVKGFSVSMERQKEEARANWVGSGESATEVIWFSVYEKVGATEFLGYETGKTVGLITVMMREGTLIESAREGSTISVVVNQTPFYGESGGQKGDTGIISGKGFVIEISDTQKKGNGILLHNGCVIKGEVKIGDSVELVVNSERRARIRSNHSATHLLHAALRETLGTHVVQKGSLVASDRLRFDFSHPKPVTAEELNKIEEIVNKIVLQNYPVTTQLMTRKEAAAEGAMALFGEKYGDVVRVVSMGEITHGSKTGKNYSIELCAGTHVRRTGDIGPICIISEGAVAAGVRRIEALTGEMARRYLKEQDERIKAIATLLKTMPAKALDRMVSLLEERHKLEKELMELRKKFALSSGSAQGSVAVHEMINGINFVGKIVFNISPRDLKQLGNEGKRQLGSGVIVFINVNEAGKANAVVGVTDDLTGKISAVNLVQAASIALGGSGGGGHPDIAQAGGPEGIKASDAIAAVKAMLAGYSHTES